MKPRPPLSDEQRAKPCTRVPSAIIDGIVHAFECGYCSTHRKVMSCDHQCAAKWSTPCDANGCEGP